MPFWDVAPEQFKEAKKRIRHETNIVERFISSGKHVKREPDEHTSVEMFMDELQSYARQHQLERVLGRGDIRKFIHAHTHVYTL